jgi:hypothetical protein
MITAEDFLKFDDRPEIEISIPELGGMVIRAKEPDAATALKISKSCTSEDGKLDELEMVLRTIVEACIEPKFEVCHIEALKRKSEITLMRIFRAIKGKKNEVLKN